MNGAGDASPDSRRFDALLRNLLAFGLVERDPSGNGRGWRLSEQAQGRLDRLGAPPPATGELLYFGHRCSACGEHRPTRLRGGAYVCERCTVVAAEASTL
ncbi:MAG: hypothetical protein ACYCU7_02220 [Acidimicrobiales bacterium]